MHFWQLENLGKKSFFSLRNELVSEALSQKKKIKLVSVSDSIPASECMSVGIF